jgi:50S ribosomal subunit-associated GTPase HflX
MIVAFNKIDKIADRAALGRIASAFSECPILSVKSGEGSMLWWSA